ncbi:MAG: RNA polymerase sigma factor [Allomuricauda sp.]
MKKVDLNQKRLLQSLKKGDEAAFKSIFDLCHKDLYRFILSITKSEYAAEEILQEVFVKLWRVRKSIDTSRSFRSFLYTMTRNHTYNYLRAIAHQEALKKELWKNIVLSSQSTEDSVLFAEYETILNSILDHLPQQKRNIYILSRKEGKSNQEIADLLGISQKTVKNHLWKTLQFIKIQLQPHLTDNLA